MEPRPFRYHDEARRLGEALAEIKVAAPVVRPNQGMDLIAKGKTALATVSENAATAVAGVPAELQKQELQAKLQKLLDKKQKKVASFLAEARKYANPMVPDVSAAAMTSGNGTPTAPQVEQPVRLSGAQQGPAANLIARQLRERNEQFKAAASRLDKEVAKGNVRYQDVTPMKWYDPRDPKAVHRAEAMSAAPVSDQALERTRRLNDAKFRNAHAVAGRVDFGAEAAARRTDTGPHSPGRMAMQDRAEQRSLRNKFLPGAGPAMHKGEVFVPEESGQFLRAATNPMQAHNAVQATDPIFGDKSKLPKRIGADSTLNQAILEHERGERSAWKNPRKIKGPDGAEAHVYHPHATHFGVEPTMRENIALQGDPEAQKIFGKVRRMGGDDAVVQDMMRNHGAHPNAPLPIGGRAQRRLEDALAKKKSLLTSPGIAQTVTHAKEMGINENSVAATLSTKAERAAAQSQRARQFLRGLAPRGVNFLKSRPGKVTAVGSLIGAGGLYGAHRMNQEAPTPPRRGR